MLNWDSVSDYEATIAIRYMRLNILFQRKLSDDLSVRRLIIDAFVLPKIGFVESLCNRFCVCNRMRTM